MKKLYILLAICLLFSSNKAIQASTNYTSQNIYSYTKQISDNSKEEIWKGFDPLDFILLSISKNSNRVTFSTDPNNSKSRIIMTLSDKYFSTHTLEENISITFHEAFHAFQRSPKREGMKWGYGNARLIFEYKEISARSNALFNIEFKILREALQVENEKLLKEKVRQFLVVREYRQNELDRRFVEFEKGAELNEGLAEYAGTKAVILGMDSSKAKMINVPFSNMDSRDFLMKKYKKLDSINRIGKNVRLKFYYTGSAQGLLLDRLMPNWKTAVQMKSIAVQDLLKESVSQKTAQQNEINKILKKYNYKNILVEEEKAVEKRKIQNLALLKKTLNQKGKRVIIDFSSLNRLENIQFFDPMNVTNVKPNVRVHTRMVRFGFADTFKAHFTQAVVEDLNKQKYTSIVPNGKNLNVLSEGKTLDLSKASEINFENKLEIDSDNLKFEGKKGKIKITENEIFIKIEK